MESFFATCPRGLEPVLHDELAKIGAQDVASVEGGVKFAGSLRVCYAANLECRVASRVLWQVAHVPYRSDRDIYAAARALPWHDWFAVQSSIRVDVSAIRAPVKSLDFITLRIKDAVCDVFREASGRRPDVDTRSPEARINAFLTATHLTLNQDTSGEPHCKRG
jgi:putative N6-adenine-specific DNA methylase